MTGSAEFDPVSAFARVAQDMLSYDSLSEARAQVAALAREALNSAGTAIWHRRDDATMVLDSYTDPEFMALMSDIVGTEPDGPAWQTMKDRKTTLAADFSSETRWPRYTRRLMAESPVRSAVVYPLGLADQDLGVLAVYAHEPRHFEPAVVELGVVFAAYASLALENASPQTKTRNLEIALSTNRRIGVAVGILMARNNLTETQAFDLLRVASQNTNTKLADVADDVVYTGTLRRLALP